MLVCGKEGKMKTTKTAIIIPARYNSSRLSGKPLLKAGGKSVIRWVWERAKSAKLADEVIIATDDERIFDEAKSFGANVEMTAESHSCGSERIAEVAERHPEFGIIVNLQGDEPLIKPECIDAVTELLQNDENADITTLCTEITEEAQKNDVSAVKAVFDKNGYAMYFSRSVIPFERNKNAAKHYKHIGIYAYRREALFDMIGFEKADCERAESLEQLRALYNGMKIKIAVTDYNPVGIDTPADFEAFKKQIEG